MDYSQLGSSVHEILQARILEWVAIPFSKGSFTPRDQTQISCTAGRFFTIWATREAWAWVTLSCFIAYLLILKNCTFKKIYCSNSGSWLFFPTWRLLLSIYLFILVICLDWKNMKFSSSSVWLMSLFVFFWCFFYYCFCFNFYDLALCLCNVVVEHLNLVRLYAVCLDSETHLTFRQFSSFPSLYFLLRPVLSSVFLCKFV